MRCQKWGEGGGRGEIGMGNTCKSMADSCQCMTKPLQYCKVISLQLIKKKTKKENTVSDNLKKNEMPVNNRKQSPGTAKRLAP